MTKLFLLPADGSWPTDEQVKAAARTICCPDGCSYIGANNCMAYTVEAVAKKALLSASPPAPEVESEDIKKVIVEDMFAPHELPLSDFLNKKYDALSRKILTLLTRKAEQKGQSDG